MIRQIVSYGDDWPDFRWPNGSRLAASVVIKFEEGVERELLEGDLENEGVGEVTSVVPEGRPGSGLAQILASGTRSGAWRMMEALTRLGIPVTLLVCGRAAERARHRSSQHLSHMGTRPLATADSGGRALITTAARRRLPISTGRRRSWPRRGKRRRGFSAEAPGPPERATFRLRGATPVPRTPSTTTCPTAIHRGLSSCPTHSMPTI